MKLIPVILLCGLLLTACGTRELQVTSAPTQIAVTQAADPTPVQMAPVHFRVVTPENLDAFLTEMRTTQGNNQFVIVTLQMRDYENLILNLAELRRYIEQQQHVILFYRRMTAPSN
jgi:hypothetical protein